MSKINQVVTPSNGEIDDKTRGSIRFSSAVLQNSDVFVTDEVTLKKMLDALNDQNMENTKNHINESIKEAGEKIVEIIDKTSDELEGKIEDAKNESNQYTDDKIQETVTDIEGKIAASKQEAIDASKQYTDEEIKKFGTEVDNKISQSIADSIVGTIEPMVDKKIEDATKDFATKDAVTTEIETAITKSETKITTELKNTYNELNQNIAKNSLAITELGTFVDSNRESIKNLDQAVSEHNIAINHLHADLSNAKDNISTLDGAIESLKTSSDENLTKGLENLRDEIGTEITKVVAETDEKLSQVLNSAIATVTDETDDKLLNLKQDLTKGYSESTNNVREYAETLITQVNNLVSDNEVRILLNESNIAKTQSEVDRLKGSLVIIPGFTTETSEELENKTDEERKQILDKHVLDNGKTSVEVNYCVITKDKQAYIYRPAGWMLDVSKAVAIATETTPGTVLSDTKTSGNVSVAADGKMTVVGFSTLAGKVELIDPKIEKALMDAKEYTNDREIATRVEIARTNKNLETLERDKVDSNTDRITKLEGSSSTLTEEVANLNKKAGQYDIAFENLKVDADRLDKYLKKVKEDTDTFLKDEFTPLKEEVKKNKQETDKNLSDLSNKVTNDIAKAVFDTKVEVEKVMEQSIIHSAAALTEDLQSYSDANLKTAKEYTDKSIKELNTNTSTEIDEKITFAGERIQMDYNAKFHELNEKVEKADAEIKSTLEGSLDAAIKKEVNDRNEAIDIAKAEIERVVEKNIIHSAAATEANANEYADKQDLILKGALTTSITKVSDALEAFKTSTNNTLSTVEDALTDMNTKVEGDISNLKHAYNAVTSLIGKSHTDLDNKINNAKVEITKAYQEADDKWLEKAKEYTDSKAGTSQEDFTKVTDKLREDITKNTSSITALDNKGIRLAEYIDSRLDVLGEKVYENESRSKENELKIEHIAAPHVGMIDTAVNKAKLEVNKNFKAIYDNLSATIIEKEKTTNENIKTAYNASKSYTDTKIATVTESVTKVQEKADKNETEINKINQELQYRDGALVYVGTIDKTVDELEAMTKEDREAALTKIVTDSQRPAPKDMYAVRTKDDSTYYFLTDTWVLKRLYQVAQATDDTLGIVKGRNEEGYGSIQGDGSIKVVGFDILKTDVANKHTELTEKIEEAKNEAIQSAATNTETKVQELKDELNPKIEANKTAIEELKNNTNTGLNNAVTLDGKQTITGEKTFTADIIEDSTKGTITITAGKEDPTIFPPVGARNTAEVNVGIILEAKGEADKKSYLGLDSENNLTLKSPTSDKASIIAPNADFTFEFKDTTLKTGSIKLKGTGTDTNVINLVPLDDTSDLTIKLADKTKPDSKKIVFDSDNQHTFVNLPEPTEDGHPVNLKYFKENADMFTVVAPLSKVDGVVSLQYTEDFKVDLTTRTNQNKLALNRDAGVIKELLDKDTNLETLIGTKADDNTVVKLTTDQEIDGTKTFKVPVIVPKATEDNHAVNRVTLEEILTNKGYAVKAEENTFTKSQIITNTSGHTTLTLKAGADNTASYIKVANHDDQNLLFLGKVGPNTLDVELSSLAGDLHIITPSDKVLRLNTGGLIVEQGEARFLDKVVLGSDIELGRGRSNEVVLHPGGVDKELKFSKHNGNTLHLNLENKSKLTGIMDPENERDAVPMKWVEDKIKSSVPTINAQAPLKYENGTLSLDVSKFVQVNKKNTFEENSGIDLQNHADLTGVKDPVNDRDATPKSWVVSEIEKAVNDSGSGIPVYECDYYDVFTGGKDDRDEYVKLMDDIAKKIEKVYPYAEGHNLIKFKFVNKNGEAPDVEVGLYFRYNSYWGDFLKVPDDMGSFYGNAEESLNKSIPFKTPAQTLLNVNLQGRAYTYSFETCKWRQLESWWPSIAFRKQSFTGTSSNPQALFEKINKDLHTEENKKAIDGRSLVKIYEIKSASIQDAPNFQGDEGAILRTFQLVPPPVTLSDGNTDPVWMPIGQDVYRVSNFGKEGDKTIVLGPSDTLVQPTLILNDDGELFARKHNATNPEFVKVGGSGNTSSSEKVFEVGDDGVVKGFPCIKDVGRGVKIQIDSITVHRDEEDRDLLEEMKADISGKPAGDIDIGKKLYKITNNKGYCTITGKLYGIDKNLIGGINPRLINGSWTTCGDRVLNYGADAGYLPFHVRLMSLSGSTDNDLTGIGSFINHYVSCLYFRPCYRPNINDVKDLQEARFIIDWSNLAYINDPTFNLSYDKLLFETNRPSTDIDPGCKVEVKDITIISSKDSKERTLPQEPKEALVDGQPVYKCHIGDTIRVYVLLSGNTVMNITDPLMLKLYLKGNYARGTSKPLEASKFKKTNDGIYAIFEVENEAKCIGHVLDMVFSYTTLSYGTGNTLQPEERLVRIITNFSAGYLYGGEDGQDYNGSNVYPGPTDKEFQDMLQTGNNPISLTLPELTNIARKDSITSWSQCTLGVKFKDTNPNCVFAGVPEGKSPYRIKDNAIYIYVPIVITNNDTNCSEYEITFALTDWIKPATNWKGWDSNIIGMRTYPSTSYKDSNNPGKGDFDYVSATRQYGDKSAECVIIRRTSDKIGRGLHYFETPLISYDTISKIFDLSKHGNKPYRVIFEVDIYNDKSSNITTNPFPAPARKDFDSDYSKYGLSMDKNDW